MTDNSNNTTPEAPNAQPAPPTPVPAAQSASSAAPAAKQPRSAAAIVALVLGIVALALSLIPIINNLAFFLAIIALVFGIVAIVGIKRGKKSGMGMAIAALIITVIAGGAVLASQAAYSAAIDQASTSINSKMDKMTGDATEELIGTDVDITLGEFSMKKDSYGLIKSKLPVTVTNLTDKTESFSIQLEAVNASGKRIMDGYVYANDLKSGQTQDFEAFTYVSSDDYKAMQSVTFNIVSVSEF